MLVRVKYDDNAKKRCRKRPALASADVKKPYAASPSTVSPNERCSCLSTPDRLSMLEAENDAKASKGRYVIDSVRSGPKVDPNWVLCVKRKY